MGNLGNNKERQPRYLTVISEICLFFFVSGDSKKITINVSGNYSIFLNKSPGDNYFIGSRARELLMLQE